MPDNTMSRFLGGSPLVVLLRLVVVSVLVGALMSWLRIDPADIVVGMERGIAELWSTGFVALREVGRTALVGAAIVVPVWLITRMMSYRGPRLRRPDPVPPSPSRWNNPAGVGEQRRS